MNDTAMIAFLPANGSWVKQDFPHMTLIFNGPIEGREMTEFNEMGKDAITAARTMGSFSLNTIGVEQLGDNGEEVDALILYPTPQLLVARSFVEKWNKSENSDFKPYVTIGPAGAAYVDQVPVRTNSDYSYKDPRESSQLPNNVYFDRLAICWGDKRLIFSLSSLDY